MTHITLPPKKRTTSPSRISYPYPLFAIVLTPSELESLSQLVELFIKPLKIVFLKPLGPLFFIDEDSLIKILYFLLAPHFKEQITTALDTRKATNPGIQIHGEDILDIIRQLASDQSNQEDKQILGINAKEKPFPKKGKDKEKVP
ncbi:hypothetical protein O181_008387 [Austropuccinia psidii MF-1]|uniref:Uncharacterized protein n=1 Tax=Austropuccinia psidii MF-1 TaxID=1389203 RepID=A0A9Q3GJC3_9BASI|nr:hypothetical protein [Austropuccinia psidii MF-1]